MGGRGGGGDEEEEEEERLLPNTAECIFSANIKSHSLKSSRNVKCRFIEHLSVPGWGGKEKIATRSVRWKVRLARPGTVQTLCRIHITL